MNEPNFTRAIRGATEPKKIEKKTIFEDWETRIIICGDRITAYRSRHDAFDKPYWIEIKELDDLRWAFNKLARALDKLADAVKCGGKE